MPRMIPSALASVLLCACGDNGGTPATSAATHASNQTGADSDSSGTTTSGTTSEGESSTGAPATTTGTTGAPDPTSTGGTAEPGTTSSGTDGCQGFICQSDQGGNMIECDVWTQDCEEGQKCMPYSGDGDYAWESTKCVPVMENPASVGDPCFVEGSGVSGIDNCEKGAMCWDVVMGEGICVAQCIGSPDAPSCPPSGGSCLISNDGVLTLCLPTCDPLLQDCDGDDLCIPNPQNFVEFLCVLDASGEEGQLYDPCEYINACDKGFFCANPMIALECDAGAIGCCMPFCDITEVGVCTGQGQECLPWYEPGQAPPGYESLGYCSIPG
ncbi:MAG TPA: ribulose phosphate epimerase [Nannocystis sp.]